MHIEREIAIRAYRHAKGIADMPREDSAPEAGTSLWQSRNELIELLDEIYQGLGVSNGPKESRELIRDIETQSVKQVDRQI